MNELYKLGISSETIKTMLEMNPNIGELSDDEVKQKEELLKYIGCSDREILNIISSNAMYLDRTEEDILKLIMYLKKVGFICLNILFDANPYILNLDVYEIEKYIKSRLDNNEKLEDIVDDMDSNPYLFNEI